MKKNDNKQPDFKLPKVISIVGENSKESKKMTAEEHLKNSLSEGTLRTNIRLAPESRIAKDIPESQLPANDR